MGLFSKIKLNDILKAVGVVATVAPVVIKTVKTAIQTKGKSVPDAVVTGVEIANALGGHHDRLTELETIVRAAQGAGVLPSTEAAKELTQ